uniref:MMS19 nucleotide excision repair protein n=1 Tax=Scophthalmus maximus TaxID=52904 RepID=A0A8D3E1A3_SCOMX
MAADGALLLSLVEEFVSGLQDSKAKDTAAGVRNGQFTVLQLVEALGLSLTSSQPHTRARGVQLLSEVLHECYGNLTEREVLIAFYENRLKDHYVITPSVLQGLRALTKCAALPPGSAVSMLRSLFQDVHVQLKGLGADFVFGFVQSMDGERDPRNLLLAFQIAKNIVHRGYDLGKFTEELFEVTSCYFPIDFSPPPNDPHGITKEELIETLRAVLTGTPKFAEFLLPLIIEKLDSDVQSAKLDSLQTLTACVSQYEHKDLAEFLEGLWTSLRREVFQTSSERIESAGLAAVTALTSCLSRSVLNSDSEDSLSTFLDLVLKDCKHHLCEPDLKLVWPSAKLLQAACSASSRASHATTAAVMPSLIEQYSSRTQANRKRFSLIFVLFVPSALEESVFSAFRQSLCGMVFSALSETNASLQITATSMLTSLAQLCVPGLLLDSDVELAVDHLTRLLLTEEDDRVRSLVFFVIETLTSVILVQNKIPDQHLPLLSSLLCSEPMDEGDNRAASGQPSHHAMRQRCLSALAAVSTRPGVVRESTPVLLEVLGSVHAGHFAAFSVEEVVSACHSLRRIAEQVQDTEEMGRCFHEVVIPRLISLALQAALQGKKGSSGRRSPLVEEVVLSAVVSVISTSCARLQPMSVQCPRCSVSFFHASAMPVMFPQKQQGDSWSRSQMVCLLMGCVCSLPRSVEVPQIDQLMSQLEELSCTCSHPLSYNSTPVTVCRELDSSSSPVRTQALTLMIWVSKALLLRYHPLSTALTDKLFSLLDDTDLGAAAADGFSLLMSDSSDVLNRGCHADVRIMYRQRFFSENSAKLVQGFNAAPQEKKSNYLKALSNIVNKLPKQVQITELPALLSLLLEALSCPDQGVQLSTLSCLEPVLVDPPPALIQQLEALVSRLLALTSSPTMSVKIASMRCIHAISRFPEHEILPFRARVLRALARPLDDRKRLVRSEAVQARGEWFLVGSPGGR